MTFVAKKILRHPKSRTTIGQIPALCSVKPRPNTTSVTSIIIDSGATGHFFGNQDLFPTYTEYQHEFETGTGQRSIAHGYVNVILRMCDMSGNVNTLTVTNMSWVPELGHNLLSSTSGQKGYWGISKEKRLPIGNLFWRRNIWLHRYCWQPIYCKASFSPGANKENYLVTVR